MEQLDIFTHGNGNAFHITIDGRNICCYDSHDFNYLNGGGFLDGLHQKASKMIVALGHISPGFIADPQAPCDFSGDLKCFTASTPRQAAEDRATVFRALLPNRNIQVVHGPCSHRGSTCEHEDCRLKS